MPVQAISFFGTRQVLPETVGAQDDLLQLEDSYVISGTTRDAVNRKTISLSDDKLVEFVFDDNTTWLCHADTIEEVFPEAANPVRSADGTFQIPQVLHSTSSERGIAGDIALKAVNLFAKKAIHKKVNELAEELEKKQLGNLSGLYQLDENFRLVAPVPKQTEGPYLLFIHGTASSTEGSFGKLKATETWKELRSLYGENIIAFQHETLTKSPLQNVAELVYLLPQTATLHLVTHSRGGLIGDILARFCNSDSNNRGFDEQEIAYLEKTERKIELKFIKEIATVLQNKDLTIPKFIRVACPANGTILASKRLDNFFNITANLVGFGTGVAASPVYGAFRNLIAAIVDSKNNEESLPGIEAMNPDSPFIKIMNTPASTIRIKDPLVIISGNCKAGFNLKGLLIIASKLFYFTDNDLVVNTASMYQGSKRQLDLKFLFDDGGNVDHFHYFQNEKTRKALVTALREDGDLLTAGFKTEEQAVLAQRQRNAQLLGLEGGDVMETTVSGKKPIVVLLPGIMGSNISLNKDKIWIDYRDFISGGLGKLKIDNKNLKATSIVKTSYGRLTEYLKKTYDVVTFAYDWRLNLAESVALFNEKMKELMAYGQPVKIIGHSMGGVLVRDFILTHHDTWQLLNASSGFRLIFLGSPLGGSFRIPAVLFGKDAIIDKLSMIDIVHTKKELLQIFTRFPGLLNLLPLSTSLDNDFSKLMTWRRMAEAMGDANWPLPAVADKELEWFRKHRENVLENSDKIDFTNICYIAGKDRATPCGYRIDETARGRELVFLSTAEGDQSVTWESGIPKKLIEKEAVYYVNVSHGALTNDPKIFDGIAEILAKGSTRLLSKTRPVVRGEEKVFRAPEIRDFDLSEAGLEKTILGLESQEKSTKVEMPIQVSISNGDLDYAAYPVLAGHFLNDSILYAEAKIDQMLNGALTERYRIGVYPGEIGTSHLHVSTEGKGAIIVGLGSFGQLSTSLLSKTVEQGVASYLLDVNEKLSQNKHAGKQELLGISSLVIASGYGGLSIENAVNAIVQGVQNANTKIDKLKEGSYRLIEHIEFIELYEDRALSCFYALRKMTKAQAVSAKVYFQTKEIRRVFGSKQRIPVEYAEAWWNRITVQVDEKTKESNVRRRLLFNASTLGAREESQDLYINPAGLERLLNESTDENQWSPRLGKTLFEMLLPLAFKEQFKKRFNINWILDKAAAALPWELLQDNSSDARPLCVNAGMIRQLVTKDYRQKISQVAANNALIVAEPELNGFLSELPGALKEGLLVMEKLEKNGLKVQSLMRSSSAEILPALHADDYKIIHLAGHGTFEKDNPEESGMVIGENSFLTSADIGNMSTVPELVFVNCCHLGRTDAAAEEYYRYSYRLAANIGTQLIENGVKAVVVAGWAVSDDAALRFTEVFYQHMFEGDCFGDAVRKARAAIYEEFHAISNTWGAYQCYGDPFYKFYAERLDGEEEKEFVIPQEAIIELNNLQSKIRTGRYKDADVLKKLAAITEAVDAANIRTAVITEKEAHIYAALHDYNTAIKKFEEVLGMEKADFSVTTIEKYSNVLMKKCVADFKKVNQNKKGADKEKLQRLQKKADKAISDLESLVSISPTSERYSLLGSAYKRKAFLSSGAEKRKAYSMAAYFYRQACEKDGKQLKAYALTNWIELECILTSTGDRKWKDKVKVDGKSVEYSLPLRSKLVEQVSKLLKAAKEQQLQTDDYWKLMEVPNHLLCLKFLDTSNAKDGWDKLEETYRKIWNMAGAKGDKYAEIEHLELLVDALSISQENNRDLRENIERLKKNLEKEL